MESIMNTKLFDNFGKISYVKMSNISNIISITDVVPHDSKIAIFKESCEHILTSDNEFNVMMLRNVTFHMTNQTPEILDELLIQIFDNVTKNIANDFDKNIQIFTISSFIETYKLYYLRSIKLLKYLSYFDSKVNTNNQNKYSHIGLIRSYTFYNNVLNRKYDSKYLYEIFTEHIENGLISMTEVLQLFKMYLYYIKLSETLGQNKEKVFNLSLNNLFLVTLGSNQTFIRTLTQYIHDNIKSISDTENEKTENNITELINLVSNHFLDKDLFNLYYEKLLEVRLLSPKCNFEIEKKLIEKFKRPNDNKVIQNMLYKIMDIQDMASFKKIYRDATISVTSDKFKNRVDKSTLDREKIDAKLFRKFAWSDSHVDFDIPTIKIPYELEHNIAIYDRLYDIKYPHREIAWNFNHGIGIINLTLGEKTYHVETTTLQLFILLQFNHREKITATDLASNLGMTLQKLGNVLQTLLRAKILKRDINKKNNDPSMEISLNHEYSSQITNISIVPSTQPQQQLKNIESDIDNQYMVCKETKIQACVVRTMKQNKKMTYIELFNKVKMSLTFPIEEDQFAKTLNQCVADNLIEKTNSEYIYIP